MTAQTFSLHDLAPLRGVRVLSLAQQLPGPYAGMLLAELGADVVLIEQPVGGDPARQAWPLFESVNRGKRSLAVDLKTSDGWEVIHRLAGTARIVLEGFRPGVAARLGVDFESLRHRRADIVYCSISGYGQDSHERQTPGHDISYQTRAAGVEIGGQLPADGGYPIADLSAAMFAALSVTSALLCDQPTYVDVSLADCALAFKSPQLAVSWRTGQVMDTARSQPAYGVFRTANGWISLSVMHEDHFWAALCLCLKLPELAELTATERAARAGDLRDCLVARIAAAPTQTLLPLLVDAGVPAGPVNSPISVRTDPLFRQRGAIVGKPGHEQIRTPLSRHAVTPPSAAPQLGADTLALLAELGFTETQSARLLDSGVVAAPRCASG